MDRYRNQDNTSNSKRTFPYATTASAGPQPPLPEPPSLSSYRSPSSATATNAPLLSTGSAASPATNWESLRKHARKLENEVDAKLVAFSRNGAVATGSGPRSPYDSSTGVGGGHGRKTSISVAADGGEAELDDLLRRLTQVVSEMGAYLEGPNATQATPSMVHMLQRHRDILYDYTREFKNTKANIQHSKEHAELLSSVRDDISSYRSGASSAQDMLLTERGRIDSSHRMTDNIIQQAYDTKESLSKQRGSIFGMNRRIFLVTSQIPGLNSIIGKVSTRKRRDTIILSGVIAFCIILLLMYMF